MKTAYTFTNEQGKLRTITTVEEAKAVIIATSMVRFHNYTTLLEDNDIAMVANAFGLSLEDVVIRPSSDPDDPCYVYSFIEK